MIAYARVMFQRINSDGSVFDEIKVKSRSHLNLLTALMRECVLRGWRFEKFSRTGLFQTYAVYKFSRSKKRGRALVVVVPESLITDRTLP